MPGYSSMVHGMAALVALGTSTCVPSRELPDEAEVEEAARETLLATHARGIAIALIDDGAVRSVQAFGERNTSGDSLSTNTVMYGASLTKAVFGYLVCQLADEGKLHLDRPIAEMLDAPIPDYGRYDDNRYGDWADLAGDPRWRAITPRMALTHSTGFANYSFLEPDKRLHIHFDPGTRYSYSGDGIILLQFGIEEGLDLDIEAELQRRFFTRLGMTRTSLRWNPSFGDDLADGWQVDGTAVTHDERGSVRASGSMDTTIDDLARMVAHMVRGDGLSPAMARECTRPQRPIDTASQFPTLGPALPPDQRISDLSAALGVVTFSGPQGPGWFKGGHNEWTANTLVCLERGDRCVLILANDVRAEAGFGTLVRRLLGDTGVPYQWEYRGLYGY